MKWAFVVGLLWFPAICIASPPSYGVEVTCPLCKTKFEAITGGEGGCQSTMRLDLMPVGAITPAYPKPVCPKCGFVGRFEEARKHFEGLKAIKNFQGNFLEQIVDYQLRLIADKDEKPHTVKELPGKK